MKQSLFSSARFWGACLFCLAAVSSFGQCNPFKGANTILITTDLADKEAYLLVIEQLTNEGISFTANDKNLLIRSEGLSGFGKQNAVFEGQLSVNTGLVTLSGWVRNKPGASTQSSDKQLIPIEYNKGKSSLQGTGFNYMDTLAKKLQSVLHGVTMYKYKQEII